MISLYLKSFHPESPYQIFMQLIYVYGNTKVEFFGTQKLSKTLSGILNYFDSNFYVTDLLTLKLIAGKKYVDLLRAP